MKIRLELRAPRRFWIILLGSAVFFATVENLCSLEQVQLTVFYPAPSGAYQQLLVNHSAYLAATAGGIVQVGAIQTPSAAPPELMVNGNMGIGTTNPAVNGLHIGAQVPGGQAQIHLDNAQGEMGQINRWTNRTEIYATDAIGFGAAANGSTNYNGDALWVRQANNSVPTNGFSTLTMQNVNGDTTMNGAVEAQAFNYTGAPNTANVLANCRWVTQAIGEGFFFNSVQCPSGYAVSGGASCFGAALVGNSLDASGTAWDAVCAPAFLLWPPGGGATGAVLCCQQNGS